MDKAHLRDIELAWLSDEENALPLEREAHLRWCGRCRSALAEYRWLQKELAVALADAAESAPAPRLQWQAVRSRVSVERRGAANRRVSAFASMVLAVCFALSLSTFLSPTLAARTPQPEPAAFPAPLAAASVVGASTATPTPAAPGEQAEMQSTPSLIPPPTPAGGISD